MSGDVIVQGVAKASSRWSSPATDTARARGRWLAERLRRGAAVLATMALLVASGCVTRLARPAYEGTVIDAATRAPLLGVNVVWRDVRLVTDAQGKFAVPARTYREMTWPGREAPPLHFSFSLQKEGYCQRFVQHLSKFGGADSEGPTWRELIPLIPVSSGPCPPLLGP